MNEECGLVWWDEECCEHYCIRNVHPIDEPCHCYCGEWSK